MNLKERVMSVNNVTRFLDSRNVQYSTFDLPTQKLGAVETASFLGVSTEVIFKSIVIIRKNPGKPILAVVPATSDVNLKALAKVLGEKKVSPATQKEAERLTKLQVGGISPLALINRGFDIIMHESVLEQESVHVSGGELGLNIRLPSKELVELTRAKVAKIC
jgi:Cys-tRNA(Pro)/Cys-tRNA(Cys) deacylase